MWKYTLAPVLMMLSTFAVILAVPVCLGVLFRLLIRKTQPNLVAWFGAALGLAVQHGAARQDTMMSITDVLPSVGESLLATFSVGAIGILVPLALWFIFVKWGVELVDRQAKQQSKRFWPIMCPIIAETVNVCILFSWLCLLPILGTHSRFSHAFSLLYRFWWVELVCVAVAAFSITLIGVNRSNKRTPNRVPVPD
jgi:hypothetical protein